MVESGETERGREEGTGDKERDGAFEEGEGERVGEREGEGR